MIHPDFSTPMVAVNVLYQVGARDERPDRTGFAHLFEHLMFGGSTNAPDFDEYIQLAGGENNAFTNNDITNYYEILPAENLETALWLESDRMSALNFDERSLETQRRVVLEEFKENCINEPYGDAWHHLSDMAYKVHPYRWPTIGKIPRHVEEAKMEEVQEFYQKFYRPNNAILVIAGPIQPEQGVQLAEKWFEDIPAGPSPQRVLPQEPPQKKLEQRISQAKVPMDALYLAFHTPDRLHPDFYAADLLSDLLCNGPSARLYRCLLKEKKIVSHIDCYISGSIDPGLLVIEARPSFGISLEKVSEAIWWELELLKEEGITEKELTKWKNKVQSSLAFSELNILNKAMNLAFFECLGRAELINEEKTLYQQLTTNDLNRMARVIITEENCSELQYRAQ